MSLNLYKLVNWVSLLGKRRAVIFGLKQETDRAGGKCVKNKIFF